MTGAVAYPRPADTGAHLPKEIMLTDVRWYVAYPLSTTRSSDPLRWEVLLHYQCASMWGRRSPRSSLLSSISAALDTRRFRVMWRKRHQGTCSKKGNRWLEWVLSSRHPCRIRGRPTFPLLVEVVPWLFQGKSPDLSWLTQHECLPVPAAP